MPCGASPNYHTMIIEDQIPRGGLFARYCLYAECESFVLVVFCVYFYLCFFVFSNSWPENGSSGSIEAEVDRRC